MIEQMNSKKWLFLAYLIAFLVFLFKGLVVLDPDFGWHYKMGELIIKSGIPQTDPFSYTMPSYPVIDSEWLTNIIFYLIYGQFGMLTLVLIFALIALASLVLSIPKKASIWSILPFVILSWSILFRTSGVRPQVISWFFFALLIKILISKELFERFKFYIPLLFIPWANLHGGFAAGLAVLGLTLVIKTWEKKKIEIENLVIGGFSILATFINPYGVRIWREVWDTFSSRLLHLTINEWVPSVYRTDLDYMFVLTLSSLLVFWSWRKLDKVRLGLFILLLVAAISSIRNVPLWLFLTFDLLAVILPQFYSSIKKIPFATKRFWIIYKIIFLSILLGVVIWFYPIVTDSWGADPEGNYPKGAVQYFQQNPPEGRIFAPYGWGGYLIWKLPQEKVFVDGRMAIWQRDNAPQGESINAYKEFLQIDNGENNPLQILKKYQVKYVLLPQSKSKLSDLEKLEEWIFPTSKTQDLDQLIEKENRKKIYQDEVSKIYLMDDPT
jgi:hypothetical protein